MHEIMEASATGTLEEAFGAGTAVSVAIIEEIGYKDKVITFPESHPVAADIRATLDAIKTQEAEDKIWLDGFGRSAP